MVIDQLRLARTENVYRLARALGCAPYLPAHPRRSRWHDQLVARVARHLLVEAWERRAGWMHS